MVSWFAPSTLGGAILEVGASKLFARFADKRELQAGLPCEQYPFEEADLDEDGCLWIDFASDVGDGFDSTYTIAWLLAQPALDLRWDDADLHTSRGRFLVLGGDQVYPAASWERYEQRFVGPYRAALPFVRERQPKLFAVPGNHDWYDGLTSFMRLFCQRRWIGGWRTSQHRSYFAIQLPQRWWLWGIDIQLDTYIDEPQLAYFDRMGEHLRPGDKVVLVTSKPSWVHAEQKPTPQSWRTLTYFEERYIKGRGAVLPLTVTGDIHHYCHYRGSVEPAHRVTSGGGGAYLSATHTMPDPLKVEPHGSSAPTTYTRAAIFPDAKDSEWLSRGVLRLLNPNRTRTLGVLTGSIYAAFALVLAAGVKDQEPNILAGLADGVWALLGDALTPWAILFAGLLILLLCSTADVEADGKAARRWKAVRYGLVHAGAHLVPLTAATLFVLWRLRELDIGLWGLREVATENSGFWPGYLTALIVFVVGVLWGRSALTLYFHFAHKRNPRQHDNDVFASQSIEGYKEFLRMRLDPSGELTVFPIGVREAVKDWTFRGPGQGDELLEPWYEPASGRPPQPELIEKPFKVC